MSGGEIESGQEVAAPELSFGRWLRIARENAGFSQTQAAQELGLSSHTMFSFWERDQRRPSPQQLCALVRMLDAPWLIEVVRDDVVAERDADLERARVLGELLAKIDEG